MPEPFVSILMLTHNAPSYVETSVRSVRERTAGVAYELVVVDNASEEPTRRLVTELHVAGLIDTLKLMDTNTLFAGGNNIAAGLASPQATHFLLLNSDIEVKGAGWLAYLLERHRRGALALGVVGGDGPPIADGYCFLVDADLYRAEGLDESHQWWWAVTKFQGSLLRQGLSVRAYREHEALLHHFGGASGKSFVGAKGMDVSEATVKGWMGGHRPEIFASVDDERREVRLPRLVTRALRRARRVLGTT